MLRNNVDAHISSLGYLWNNYPYIVNTYPICDSPLKRSARRSFTLLQISPPPKNVVCVNRGPIRYGFHASAKAILYSVNITWNTLERSLVWQPKGKECVSRDSGFLCVWDNRWQIDQVQCQTGLC